MSRYLFIISALIFGLPSVASAEGQLGCHEFMESELGKLCRRPKESYVAEWQARNPDATQRQRYYFMLNLVKGWRDCQMKELDKRGYKYTSYYPIECRATEPSTKITTGQISHPDKNTYKTSYRE